MGKYNKDQIGVTEYDDECIERHVRLLRDQFPHIYGLESTGLGISKKDEYMPRFSPVPTSQKFVQTLHRTDHWLCVTNICCENDYEVYIYERL